MIDVDVLWNVDEQYGLGYHTKLFYVVMIDFLVGCAVVLRNVNIILLIG